MATALDDFVAPDCRFINIKRGQTVYVYSKLLPVEGAGVFWSGSVCARFDLSLALSARNTICSISLLHMRRPMCVIPEHNRLQTTVAHASTIFDYTLYDNLMHFHLRCFQQFRYSLSQKQNIYNLTIKGKEKSTYPRLACIDILINALLTCHFILGSERTKRCTPWGF